MKKAFLCLATAFLAASGAMAQVVVKTGAGDLSLRLIGRTNLDYGRYFSHSDNFNYGFKMNDTRLGVLANFDEKWSAKIEFVMLTRLSLSAICGSDIRLTIK